VNDDDVIDNRLFGNIFHEAARIIYTRLTAKSHQITAADIDQLLHQRVAIHQAVDEAFRQELFHVQQQPLPPLNGLQLISREVIIHYLRQLLQLDRRLAPFTILGLETDVRGSIDVHDGDTVWQAVVGGRIDRLDVVGSGADQRVRVIDYKTGSRRLKPLSDVEAVFQQDSLQNHSDYYLQAILYSCLVKQSQALPVSPALLFIQHASASDYDPTLCFGQEPITDVADIQSTFMQLLQQQVAAIFDTDIPFAPTADRARCRTCAFKELCRLGS